MGTEGYGPGGAAIMLKVLTDNSNRSASEIRAAFSRRGGNLGDSGSVAWIFESKAIMTLEEIGTYVGRTRERVRQIKEKALQKLRHPNRSEILKEYYGESMR